MNFKEINFNKKNRRPTTDTTYQISAEEWNAVGTEMKRQQARLNEIDPDGGGTGDAAYVTDAELETLKGEIEEELDDLKEEIENDEYPIMTLAEYTAITNKKFHFYFVARDTTDKLSKRCWRVYLRSQLILQLTPGSNEAFPMKFPIRLT